MAFKIYLPLLLVCVSHCTLVAGSNPPPKAHVVIVFAEAGKAQESASVEIEPGTTLASLFFGKRPVPNRRPLNMQQGFLEFRRLPTLKREGVFLTFTNAEIRKRTKGEIPLEDGDIIISDCIADY